MTDLANFILDLGLTWDNTMVPLRLLTNITKVTRRVDTGFSILELTMFDHVSNTHVSIESNGLTKQDLPAERNRIARLSNLIFTRDEVTDILTANTGSKNLPEIDDVVSYPKLAEYLATIQQVPHATTIIGYDAGTDSFQFDTSFNDLYKKKFVDTMDPMDSAAFTNDKDRALYLAYQALNEVISQFVPVDMPPLDKNLPELGGIRGSNRDGNMVTQKIDIDNKDI